MTQFSDYLESNVINITLRGQAWTPPAGTHLALFIADPTDAGSGTEATGGWYGRQSVGTSTGWTAPADSANGKLTSNSNQIVYAAVTGAQVIVTHIGIFDSSTGGNLLYHSPLLATKTLQIGDVLQFAVGSITVTLK